MVNGKITCKIYHVFISKLYNNIPKGTISLLFFGAADFAYFFLLQWHVEVGFCKENILGLLFLFIPLNHAL